MDKVYLYDDKLVVSMWFSEDDKQEITWRDWFSLDEYWTDESPFVKGGSVEFDCFPFSSTRNYRAGHDVVRSFCMRTTFERASCGARRSMPVRCGLPPRVVHRSRGRPAYDEGRGHG